MPEYYIGEQLPAGFIGMWKGTIATIPQGWVLCDGGNGTPDLRNRFIVAADADSGGAAKTTITGAAAQTGGNTSHSHSVSVTLPINTGLNPPSNDNAESSGDYLFPTSTGSASASANNSIPPFYALAFIMKL